MGEIERVLHRNRSTIRTWETQGWLPDGLEFKRDEIGWRYWTRAQLEEALVWINRPGRRSGPTASTT